MKRTGLKMGDENWYKQGFRIMILIHRKKDGGSPRKDRESSRRVSRNEKEFDKNLEYFDRLREHTEAPVRLYSSVNERNILKAIHLFKRQQLDLENQSTRAQADFYAQTHNQFLSCLAKPQCAKTKNFLIDIDSPDNVVLGNAVRELQKHTEIIDIRETPNGFHVITEPYNPKLTPELEIKKDAMIFLK